MKKLLLAGAFLASTGLFAQSMVSTSPQNKKVVLEEFTGINCGWCPDGHAIAQAIKDQNPEDVFLINVHTGGFANPGNNQPDFRTAFGTALENQSGLTGYPAGTVNRHVFSGNTTVLNRGQWASAANQILQQESYVNVAGNAEIDLMNNELQITVEVYYTGDSPEETNKLNVAILQDNTLGPQASGGMGDNYVHMHRLVDFLTGQWGEDIEATTEGSFSEFTFTYEIPKDYRGIRTVLNDLKVIAYVAEGRHEILTADEISIEITNIADNDIVLGEILNISPTCLGYITPSVQIINHGNDTLESIDITYSVNGESPQVYTWTGSLELFEVATIELEEISFTRVEGENILEVSLPDDDVNSNNTLSKVVTPATEGTEASKLQFLGLGSGSTTTWEIKDIQGEVLYSGGPYSDSHQEMIDLHLPENCYEIIVHDSNGSGSSRIVIRDSKGTVLFQTQQNFGEIAKGGFLTNELLSVNDLTKESIVLYPNPTNGIVNIENAEGFQMEVYDILGKTIISKNTISKQEVVNLSDFAAGVYYIKLQNQNATTVKKVVVK